MIVILDFDHTLFDTHRFKLAMQQALLTEGVSPEIFERTHTQVIKVDLSGYYDPRVHVTRMVKQTEGDADEMLKLLDEVAGRSDEFLFPKSRSFLDRVRDMVPKMILMTYGEASWQERKVRHSGISGYFDRVVYAEKDKAEILKNGDFDKNQMLIVNDNLDETIRMKRACPEASCHIINLNSRQLPDEVPFPVYDSYDGVFRAIKIELGT